MPPVELSAHGFGETAVALAFGALPVAGAAWWQSGIVDIDVLLASVSFSLWVATILLIDEVPVWAWRKTKLPTGSPSCFAQQEPIRVLALGVLIWRSRQSLVRHVVSGLADGSARRTTPTMGSAARMQASTI